MINVNKVTGKDTLRKNKNKNKNSILKHINGFNYYNTNQYTTLNLNVFKPFTDHQFL